jgi:GTP-binding protein HflX
MLVGVDLGLPHFDGRLEELGLLARRPGWSRAAR